METQRKSARVQYLAAIVVSLLGGLYGMSIGWSSPTILLLTSDASPLPTGKITMEEASWITSLKPLAGMCCSPMIGIIANKYGRKWPLLLLAIPSIISWMLIWFAQNMYYIYVAALIHGAINANIYTLCQFYFVEISNDNVRGALGSTIVVSGHIGVPIAMALGAYFNYDVIPICSIAISILFTVLFFFFPETPLFLVKQNKISEAKKSIRFYQNIRERNADRKIIEEEVSRLKKLVGEMETKQIKGSSTKRFNVNENPGKKSLIIGFFLAVLNHLSGSFALICYTATIFEESGSILSPNESALIIGIIQLVGTTMVPLFVERIGRKMLYIVSTSGSIMGFGAMGSYMLFKSMGYSFNAFKWMPIVCLSFIVLSQSLAISTLSFTLTAEILPENLKAFGISICNTVLFLSSFLVLKFMPFFTDLLSFSGTMFLFGGVCIPCLLFIIFYIPETKGKTYDEIMKSLQ